ncbi:hypothetical protein MFFC18_08240 [Mariniblastus fucicola]|uniref:Uncharacterized protein n=1 Tax=Mariniblastus fucicola TaxID=980251 RepID=A0A5B9PD70_9BACT|nr:hypothetical protein MFFC18_08240 [Mariniblastus fucicola]
MPYSISPDICQQGFAMICCFFTIIAVFASYVLTLRG